MYYVKNERNGEEITDPRLNLAIEYHLLNNVQLDEPLLLFYINEPSIIIGRNQNAYEEVNRDYVEQNNIHVVRRLSGGGAVYHDFGNLSFCFITKDDGDSFRNFSKFTEPVISALHKIGVEGAELKGRNDLLINGQKFSGNAMYSKNGRMTAHGTIMFDSEIDAVVKALKPKKEKLEPKVIRKKIKSAVTDSSGIIEFDPENKPGVSNLLTIYSSFTDESIESLVERYKGAGYGQFKTDLGEAVVAVLEPIQQRHDELLESDELDDILDQGVEEARRVANKTLKKMQNAVGLGRKRR